MVVLEAGAHDVFNLEALVLGGGTIIACLRLLRQQLAAPPSSLTVLDFDNSPILQREDAVGLIKNPTVVGNE